MDLDDLEDESHAPADHLKDPHKQLVQQVLRQIYSPWAAVGGFHEATGPRPQGPQGPKPSAPVEVPAPNGWLLFKSLLQAQFGGLSGGLRIFFFLPKEIEGWDPMSCRHTSMLHVEVVGAATTQRPVLGLPQGRWGWEVHRRCIIPTFFEAF